MRVTTGGLGMLLAGLITSCTSAAPRPHLEQDVRVTRQDADVAGCRSIRLVEARTQYGTEDSEKNRSEIMKEMRRETSALGGDVLLVRPGRKFSGVAYSCGSMPAPRS